MRSFNWKYTEKENQRICFFHFGRKTQSQLSHIETIKFLIRLQQNYLSSQENCCFLSLSNFSSILIWFVFFYVFVRFVSLSKWFLIDRISSAGFLLIIALQPSFCVHHLTSISSLLNNTLRSSFSNIVPLSFGEWMNSWHTLKSIHRQVLWMDVIFFSVVVSGLFISKRWNQIKKKKKM